jgi:hypothetical protein
MLSRYKYRKKAAQIAIKKGKRVFITEQTAC